MNTMFSIGFMTWGAEGVLLRGLARYGTVGTGFGAGAGRVRVRYGDGMAKWHIVLPPKMPIEHCS